MAHRVWVLVEWVDERNVFPSYGIVNVNLLAYNNTDISVGKVIYISVKYGDARRAEILRMSDSKRYLKEHKEVLERQDQKVKNVLQLCMRTIKEMKSESQYLTSVDSRNKKIRSSQNSIPHVTVKGETSGTDSETEENEQRNHSRILHINNTVKYITPYKSKENNHRQNRSLGSPSNYQRPRIVTSSTPLPGGSIVGNSTLSTEKGTQTNTIALGQPPLDKIEEMETMLKKLYKRFNSLISQVNNLESIRASDLELNGNDASFIEPAVNGSWVENNNNNQFGETEQAGEPIINDIGAEPIVEEAGTQQKVNSSRVKTEQDKKNENTLRVRRMSAQTTNNIEHNPVVDSDMVPIGSGNATVPSRLLNEIDWNSHTAATRQLLQAVFPRKILATHSLTGKQSPAFTNKPPKKILDPKLVEDIVKTVSLRSGVPKNLVRNTITIKCTDEAKLYRTRQYRHARHTLQQHDENAPPSPASSDESIRVIN